MLTRIQTARRAFTLVELLIVIVVMAVLAMVVIPKFTDQGKRSKESALRANLAMLRSAVASFQADTGVYPTALADLVASTAPANGKDSGGTTTAITATDWHGPYLQDVPTNDSVSTTAFSYSTTAGSVGKVSSATTGYTTW
jgi:general secretion pathway protein G